MNSEERADRISQVLTDLAQELNVAGLVLSVVTTEDLEISGKKRVSVGTQCYSVVNSARIPEATAISAAANGLRQEALSRVGVVGSKVSH